MKYLLKLSLILILLLINSINLFAQATDSVWTRTFGGEERDYGRSVQQTIDNGYIIVGSMQSVQAGPYCVYLIKTDSLGDTLWTRTFGGESENPFENDEAMGYSVQQTGDGGYIIVGDMNVGGGNVDDVYLIKTDSNGDSLWTKTFGGESWDYGYSVQQTNDGGYIITGGTRSYGAGQNDVYLIKTDSVGDSLWTRTYGGSSIDFGLSVQQTTDGGYIIAGATQSYASVWRDVYLIKTDSLGDSLWARAYEEREFECAYSIQQTTDGGYILVGYTGYDGEWHDVYLLKTDSVGDTLWTRTYGGVEEDEGRSVQQTEDGGYLIAGFTKSSGSGESDVYLIKTDSVGGTLWTRTYGGEEDDEGYSVQQTNDGGCIILGTTQSYGAGENDIYLIKVRSTWLYPEVYEKIIVFPNPFKPFEGHTYVNFSNISAGDDISVYSVRGKRLWHHQGSNEGIYFWNGILDSGERIAGGVYFYVVKDVEDNIVGKGKFSVIR